MPRLTYRLYITLLLVCIVTISTVTNDSTSSGRPSFIEQISPGTSYEYTGWYVNTTRVNLSFGVTIDAVFDDYVIASIQNHGMTIPDNVSDYILSVVILHRMDIIDLPYYVGISHTSWPREAVAQLTDSNGTRVYDRNDGMIRLIDENVTNIWLFIVSTFSTNVNTQSLNYTIIICLIIVVGMIIGLVIYALYIYPRFHQYQQKKREVKIGATRKKKLVTKSKPKK